MKNVPLNFQRLSSGEYSVEKVFRDPAYDWPGDWEGRALLAFCCHYEMHGKEIPCMHEMMKSLPVKTNAKLYFGKEFDGETVDEQQLSGHNWYLRGLLKYAVLFDDPFALQAARSTVENLYLPALAWYGRYPLDRNALEGGVSGCVIGTQSGWKLSSDVGCAFMCVDGLAHYYALTKDGRVREFLDKAIALFESIDLVRYQFQTHTTLTCTRGILKLYEGTGEGKYLDLARKVLRLYEGRGMTLTYENFNWFGREDTWTEPCAVVDSLILATELYKITQEREYLTLARRIWFNGLQFCQRENGGAGPNTCVTAAQPILKISMYEAPFCCTMRYAEGLLEYTQNESLFAWNDRAEVTVDSFGRRFIDDKLLVKNGEEWQPIFSCNGHSQERAEALLLNVLEQQNPLEITNF